MSLRALEEAFSELPYALREQIIGYARSIEAASDDIFRDAGVRSTPELTDQLVFIAGVRKFYSIVDSNYWVIDNAGVLLSRTIDLTEVRIGSTDFSRRGRYHQALEEMRRDLMSLFDENAIFEHIVQYRYQDVARMLTNGR